MSKSGIIGEGQGQVIQGRYFQNVCESHTTHVTWDILDVNIETTVLICTYRRPKKYYLGDLQVKSGHINLKL